MLLESVAVSRLCSARLCDENIKIRDLKSQYVSGNAPRTIFIQERLTIGFAIGISAKNFLRMVWQSRAICIASDFELCVD